MIILGSCIGIGGRCCGVYENISILCLLMVLLGSLCRERYSVRVERVGAVISNDIISGGEQRGKHCLIVE